MAAGPSARGRLRPVLIAAAAVVAVVVAAWALQATASDGGEQGGSEWSRDDSLPPYSVSVEQGGEVLKTYGLAALHALPQVTSEMDGRDQTGPTLVTLLTDAGVSSYEEIEVRGAALRDPGRLTLSWAQGQRGVQLDFSRRGTVKVCAPWLERREWVRDVLTISVE